VAVPVPTLPGCPLPRGFVMLCPPVVLGGTQGPQFGEWDALPGPGHLAEEVWQVTLLLPGGTVPAVTSVPADLRWPQSIPPRPLQ
jgi:hypothetical protein